MEYNRLLSYGPKLNALSPLLAYISAILARRKGPLASRFISIGRTGGLDDKVKLLSSSSNDHNELYLFDGTFFAEANRFFNSSLS
jgi:hypothetical protein